MSAASFLFLSTIRNCSKICFVVWEICFIVQFLRFFSQGRSSAEEVNCICEQLLCLRGVLLCSVPWSWYLWFSAFLLPFLLLPLKGNAVLFLPQPFSFLSGFCLGRRNLKEQWYRNWLTYNLRKFSSTPIYKQKGMCIYIVIKVRE